VPGHGAEQCREPRRVAGAGFLTVGDKFNATFNSVSVKAGVRKSF